MNRDTVVVVLSLGLHSSRAWNKKFVPQAFQQFRCALRRKPEKSGKAWVHFKNDCGAYGSEDFGGTPQNQFLGPLNVNLDNVNPFEESLLDHMVERFRGHLFGVVSPGRISAKRITVRDPWMVKPGLARAVREGQRESTDIRQ